MFKHSGLTPFFVAVDQVLKLFLIFLFFWVVYADEAHKNIGRVGKFAYAESNRLEIPGSPVCNTLVHNIAVSHQQ